MMRTRDLWIAVGLGLKRAFPNHHRFMERVQKIKLPAFSVELVGMDTEVFSEDIRKKSIQFDLIHYGKDGEVGETFEIVDKLNQLFLPAFSFGEDWINVLEPVEHRLVEQDLHYLIGFSFYHTESQVIYLKDKDTGDIVPVNPDTKVTDKKNIIRELDLMRELYMNFKG